MKEKPVRFHVVGGGTDYSRRPLDEIPKFYAKADAMLVTLKADPILSLTLPGEVQSYMAVGKPIIGAIDGEAAKIIEKAKCGYCGRAENVDELVENIEQFMACDNKEELGNNARRYYEGFFERSQFMDKLEKALAGESIV